MDVVGTHVGKQTTIQGPEDIVDSFLTLWGPELLPGYDEGPVVHDGDGDDGQPVVVGVSCWINRCDLLWTEHTR